MNTGHRREWLFISRRAPWSSAAPAACADFMMTAGVFDQRVSVVFSGDGVYQLLEGQDAGAFGVKTLARVFPALGLYEIHRIHVDSLALAARGLSQDSLMPVATALAPEAFRALIHNCDRVLVF